MKTVFKSFQLSIIAINMSFFSVHADDLTVNITSPVHRAQFEKCSDITIAAEASVQNSEIKRVEFYRNGIRLISDTKLPYEYVWKNVPNGLYEFTARVLDEEDNEAWSNPVLINVGNTGDGNLLLNGEFNCQIWPWRLDQYEGAIATFEMLPDIALTDDSSAAYIDILEIGNQVWGVQLMQNFVLQSGHTYEVSFVAETYESKDIQITFSQDYDPWAPHWYEDINIDGYGEYGPYVFECNIDDPQVMFKFVLGGNLEPIFLDAVRIVDKQWTEVNSEDVEVVQHHRLNQNFPNPFNPKTTIEYDVRNQTSVEIVIFDVLGRGIRTLVSGEETAGFHRIVWNGQDNNGSQVSSGVYLCTMTTTEGFTETRKLLLLR